MPETIEDFWTTSGRVDAFAYEIIAANDLEKNLGWLEGVTSGSLDFGYDTDLKVSGKLEVTSSEIIESCLLRVHYMPRLGTEQRDIVLCTCIAEAGKMTFDKGRYKGTLELRSVLAQYIDDKLRKPFTVAKNTSLKAEFKRLITAVNGGSYSIGSDVADKTLAASNAFEVGKPPMEALQAIVDGMSAQVSVTPKGVLAVNPYKAPAKKTCAQKLPSGEYSVTLPGVELESDGSTVPNRVSYRCTVKWKQTEYVLDKNGNKTVHTSGDKKGQYKTKNVNKSQIVNGRAQVKTTSPLHFNNRGRWITANYTASRNLGTLGIGTEADRDAKIAAIETEMNTAAANKLTSVTTKTKKYIIECFYLPIECGEVVEFEHEASGLKLKVQAMVMAKEIQLSPGAKMKVTLKHVRNV